MGSDERAAGWFAANRANWDERVPIHLKSYQSLRDLRNGCGRLHPIEETELKLAPGERVIHLQCHFGCDTLTLLQKGASYVAGVDFSTAAIAAGRTLASELSIGADRACFVESNVYDAPVVYPARGEFDLAFVTWGAINWLPDIRGWANVVSYYLKPGTGRLYLAEGHPAALVFDDLRRSPDSGLLPGFLVPYFGQQDAPLVFDSDRDYSDPDARLLHMRTYEWIHPLARILEAIHDAGLQLEFLHEHDAVPWRMFEILREDPDGMYRWPAERWLPLSFSLQARKI